MTGYGASFYGSDIYNSPLRGSKKKSLAVGVTARVVKPVYAIPPVIDSIAYGLAKRFDLLQSGIQSFALLNKIQYATGQRDGFRPSLDDVWGRLYDLPRLTGESDDDYRKRLQTYVGVLTGSGTAPNTEAVINILTGVTGARVTSIWPCRVRLDFLTVEAMRAAKNNRTLIESVMPGMFAAGVDYSLIISFLDHYVAAYVKGDGIRNIQIGAAIATDVYQTHQTDAVVAINPELIATIAAYAAKDFTSYARLQAAIQYEPSTVVDQIAAIQANRDLAIGTYAAIRYEPSRLVSCLAAIESNPAISSINHAAIARSFEQTIRLIARITFRGEITPYVTAAIQRNATQTVGVRARIARRYD